MPKPIQWHIVVERLRNSRSLSDTIVLHLEEQRGSRTEAKA
mgnify:CR=1 FL=1